MELDIVQPDYRKKILANARKYCRVHGIELSTLGKRIAGDHRFFTEMAQKKRNGKSRGCTVDMYIKIVQWLVEGHLPSGAEERNINDIEISP